MIVNLGEYVEVMSSNSIASVLGVDHFNPAILGRLEIFLINLLDKFIEVQKVLYNIIPTFGAAFDAA